MAPTPNDVLASYQRLRAALRLVDRRWAIESAEIGSPYYGSTSSEFAEAMRRSRSDLERTTVLALVASAEAALFADMHGRIDDSERARGHGDALHRLWEKSASRASLRMLVEYWGSHGEVGGEQLLRMRDVISLRNWLAHGQRWSVQSAVPCEPEHVAAVIRAFLAQLPDLDPRWLPGS